MITRRSILAAALPAAASLARPAQAQSGDFSAFLAGVRAEGRRAGISSGTLDVALRSIGPNERVLELDRRQPEFTMTWEHYRSTRLSENRIAQGRDAFARNRRTVLAASRAFRVDPGVIMGIWGLETNYGTFTGGFNVVEAVATLAWDGRRASFFRPELMAALRILDEGDIDFPRMQGSYAGAMGQPQFMPTSFNRYAVDFDGDGRRDIWTDTADSLGSIANYLARCGWHAGQAWGLAVVVPPTFDAAYAGRENRLSLAEWSRMGVRRADGRPLPYAMLPASVILPDGAGGEAFLAYSNFTVIRRYNPSDFYALAVGMLGDLVVA